MKRVPLQHACELKSRQEKVRHCRGLISFPTVDIFCKGQEPSLIHCLSELCNQKNYRGQFKYLCMHRLRRQRCALLSIKPLLHAHPLGLGHIPNKREDGSCPFWCQLWRWPVWQQSISRLSGAVCLPSEVSVQQPRRPSGADSAGWGKRPQHSIRWAPFALFADVLYLLNRESNSILEENVGFT